MNYAVCLSTIFCQGCAAECGAEEMHDDHVALCKGCGNSLQATIDADAAEELATDDEIIASLLQCGESELADAAERSDRFGVAS